MRDTAVLRHYLEPLLPLLEPDDVTELVINRPGEAGIEDRQGWRWHDLPELDSEWLGTLAVAAASFTHQDIDGQTPICSTVLPGGERCQIVIPSVTPSGCPSFTIRKPSTVTLPIDQLARAGLFDTTRASARGLCAPRCCGLLQAGAAPLFSPTASRRRTRIGCTPLRARMPGCISTCRPMPMPSTAPARQSSSYSSKRTGQGARSRARPARRSALRLGAERQGGFAADLFDPAATLCADGQAGLTVLGADPRLQMVKAAQDVRDFIGRFPALRPHFDYCVIDTGPKWDELTLSAMAVADAVIAPVQVAEDSVQCAKMLLTALRKAEAARAGRKIAFLGLLPSMVNPFDRREMENAVKLAHAVGEKLMFPAFIKARPTYKHAAENHRPVWQETGSGAKAAAEEIRAVLAEIERRMTSQEVAAA